MEIGAFSRANRAHFSQLMLATALESQTLVSELARIELLFQHRYF